MVSRKWFYYAVFVLLTAFVVMWRGVARTPLIDTLYLRHRIERLGGQKKLVEESRILLSHMAFHGYLGMYDIRDYLSTNSVIVGLRIANAVCGDPLTNTVLLEVQCWSARRWLAVRCSGSEADWKQYETYQGWQWIEVGRDIYMRAKPIKSGSR